MYVLATCSWQAASTKDITSHSSCNRPKLATFLTLQVGTGRSYASTFNSEQCNLGRKHGLQKTSHHIVELLQDNVHPCAWAVAHNRSIKEQHLIESSWYLHFLSFSNVVTSLNAMTMWIYPELHAWKVGGGGVGGLDDLEHIDMTLQNDFPGEPKKTLSPTWLFLPLERIQCTCLQTHLHIVLLESS